MNNTSSERQFRVRRSNCAAAISLRESKSSFLLEGPMKNLWFLSCARFRILCLAFASVLLFGGNVAAQQASALLTGTVKDSSGALVVGAKITLRNANTNVTRTVTSNKDGDYL